MTHDSCGAKTYKLVIADDGHDAQRLHALGLRVETRRSTFVAKHNIGVLVRIQIRDAVRLDGVLEGSLALAAGIVGATAGRVVGAITVNVHVVIVARASLEEDGVGNVGAVRGASAKSA